MASENAKRTGVVVALGMPPPHKLKKSMMGSSDEGESDMDDSEHGDGGGGAMALGSMWDALKAGDKTAAWDAFCDAMEIAKAKSNDAEAKGEAYGEE